MNSEKELIASVSRKLDVLIGLMLQLQPKATTEKESIVRLREAGLSVEEIARALGKTANSVYLVLSRRRRRGA